MSFMAQNIDIVFLQFSSVQSLSRVQLCDPMNHSTPGPPVHHQLLEFTQTHVHSVRIFKENALFWLPLNKLQSIYRVTVTLWTLEHLQI